MALGPGEVQDLFSTNVLPYMDIVFMVLQLLLILIILIYAYILWKYDIKVLISEQTKNFKVINRISRAKEVKDKKTKAPKLQFFGKAGLGGEVINKPPAECIVPFRSRITNKMYHFVKKDGIYYPVQNFIVGKEVQYQDDDGKVQQAYTVEGSGLEISRDFDAEEAIQNNLMNAALKYRNKDQRNQIYLSYGLMIVTIIIVGVIMMYSLKQFGNMSGAIASLKEPLKEGVQGAISGVLGPG